MPEDILRGLTAPPLRRAADPDQSVTPRRDVDRRSLAGVPGHLSLCPSDGVIGGEGGRRTPSDSTDERTVEALARESLATCHADTLAARQTVLTSRQPEGIHRTRVALRRMRAAATLFGRALHNDKLVALRGEAKRFADACGATRDLDVFISGALKEAEEHFAGQADATAALRSFRATALRRRRSQHEAARLVLSSTLFEAFYDRMKELLAELDQAPATEAQHTSAPADATVQCDAPRVAGGARGFAREALRRRDRRLRKRLERFEELDAAQRHQVRLRAKKLRYVATFLAPLFDRKDAAAYIQAATGLQDALGLANDRLVAINVVADVRSHAQPRGRLDWGAGVLKGWLTARTLANQDEQALLVAVKRFTKAPRFWH